jgi:hypothetical protein
MMTFVFPYLHNINKNAFKVCVLYQFNIVRQVKHKKSFSGHLCRKSRSSKVGGVISPKKKIAIFSKLAFIL